MQLTIIIPVYNSQEFIANVLLSLKLQTNKNFKVIFIDDGSTDNTFNILNTVFEDSQNVKIYTKKNGGPASARNFGISLVDTEYFTFLDPDDAISNNYVDSILSSLNTDRTIYICAAYIKENLPKYMNDPLYINKSPSQGTNKNLTPLDLNRVVFKTNIIKSNNIKLKNISHYEGELFCIDYISAIGNNEILVLKDCYHLHYQRPGSLTRNGYYNQIKRFTESLPILESYIDKYNDDINKIILSFIKNTKQWIKEAQTKIEQEQS